MDKDVEQLARYRLSKTGRSRGHNAARDFNRWVHRSGKAYKVRITDLEVPIRVRAVHKSGRRKRRDVVVKYPVIHMSSWVQSIMQTCPRFFLGGYDPTPSNRWMDMFADFWENFKGLHPTHPVYDKSLADRSVTIPVAIHGDEGRGLSKTPVLIISFQVMIPSSGPENLNSSQQLGSLRWQIFNLISCVYIIWCPDQKFPSGTANLRHSFTTRLLYTLMPATLYAKNDLSIDALMAGIATDLTALFNHGVSVNVSW